MGRAYRATRAKHNRQGAAAPGPTRGRGARLTVVQTVAMTRLDQGTVVWAHVPFVDGTSEKTRPAVVCERSRRDVTLLPITTSRTRFRRPDHHVELLDLESAGIHRESAVALQPVPVDRIDIIDITGRLSPDDALRVFGTTHSVADSAVRFAHVG